MPEYSIRLARRDDISRILDITSKYAFKREENNSRGTLIPLKRQDVEYLADQQRFFVAETNSEVVGCVSLVQRNHSAELRSLVVDEHYRGKGIGSQLINAVLNEAYKIANEIDNQIYLLARNPDIFVNVGFEVVSEGNLLQNEKIWPDKVQADCIDCPIRQVCPETLLVYQIPRELHPVYL